MIFNFFLKLKIFVFILYRLLFRTLDIHGTFDIIFFLRIIIQRHHSSCSSLIFLLFFNFVIIHINRDQNNTYSSQNTESNSQGNFKTIIIIVIISFDRSRFEILLSSTGISWSYRGIQVIIIKYSSCIGVSRVFHNSQIIGNFSYLDISQI